MFFFYQPLISLDADTVKAPITCSISTDASIPKEMPIAIVLTCSAKQLSFIDLGYRQYGNVRFYFSRPTGEREKKQFDVPSFTLPNSVQIDPLVPYGIRINLGPIEPSPLPKVLLLSLAVVDPTSDREIITTNTVSITLRDGQRDEVAKRCISIAKAILLPLSFSQRHELATELAYVHDPLAVPAIALVLGKKMSIDMLLIDSLKSIGNKSARDLLISYSQHTVDPEDAMYALAAIREIDRVGIRETSPVEPNLTR